MLFILLFIQLSVQASLDFKRCSSFGAELAPPLDLTLHTLNTNYTLCWDWQQSPAEIHSVTFTTQYVGSHQLKYKKKSPKWFTVCNETTHRSCDLTALSLKYECTYMLRVRASTNLLHSNWVLKEFHPQKHAAIGPPSKVRLVPVESGLDIFITEPISSTNITMRNYDPTLNYQIVYWEHAAEAQNQTLSSNVTVVTLPNLKAWTWYCVRVRSKVFNKSSSFTSPQCMQTKGNVPWWQSFLYFLFILGMCALGLLLLYSFFHFYKTIKTTLYPPNELPPHLKKYLCDSSGSDAPGLLSLNLESELLCERVTVFTDITFLHIYNPLSEVLLVSSSGLEPDSIYSRQSSSSSSGDSGVYSTANSCNLGQLNDKSN